MSDVLTPQTLAALLQINDDVAARLIAETELPRFTIEGQVRLLSSHVLGWLGEQRGELLPRIEIAEPPAPDPRARDVLAPAKPGEPQFVSADALEALASGATDPARNLERLKIRDALLGLNDALAPALARLSAGRLHSYAHEKERTSPWRLDDHPEGRILSMSLTWATGDNGPPGFVDRPRIEIELTKGELRMVLHTQRRITEPLDADTMDALRDAGAAVDLSDSGLVKEVARVYAIGQPAPTLSTLSARLGKDLALLVPLWVRAVDG